MCSTFPFNAFANGPKGNVHSEPGGSKSVFSVIASRRNGSRNEATNSNSDPKTNDQRVEETQGNATRECETPSIVSRPCEVSRQEEQKRNNDQRVEETQGDATRECETPNIIVYPCRMSRQEKQKRYNDRIVEETQGDATRECKTPIIISSPCRMSKREKREKYLDNSARELQNLYSDTSYNEFDVPTETTNSNSSNAIVGEVSEIRERYNSYIRSTSRGKKKKNTLDRAGILNGEMLEGIIKEACRTGNYCLEERGITEYGEKFRMNINLDDNYVLRCGVFCNKKKGDSEEKTLGSDRGIDSRSTSLETNSSIYSPKTDSTFVYTSGCERGESLSQCCSPSLGGLSDSIDSPSMNYNSACSTERSTPLTPSEPRTIFPKLLTIWSSARKPAFKKNNVVVARNNIYREGILIVARGTFGVVMSVNHNKYQVFFVSMYGERTSVSDISSSDLEFRAENLKTW